MGQARQSTATPEQAHEKFFELLRKFNNAMLVTHGDPSAALHARPMAIAETSADGSIWFITGAESPKVHELAQDARVLAVMQNERQWLAVTGHGELHRDRARIEEVWREAFRAWFDGEDDPNIVLIRVKPVQAEYWDDAGLVGLRFALEFAAAYVTGKELRGVHDVNAHAKVPL